MWHRALEYFCCPLCTGGLELLVFEEERVPISEEHRAIAQEAALLGPDFDRYVTSGLLTCASCDVRFPIVYGLPVLIPYTTPIHRDFATRFRSRLAPLGDVRFPAREPVAGEQFVMRSFSTEWLDYDYDGVIWDLSYDDHEKRLLAELGPDAVRHGRGGVFLEVGCGIGLSTYFAAKNMRCDAIGVDLSLAVLPASEHFRSNPFLHFAQGSAFYLPVRQELASVLYSHGVLHHTYSTRDAVHAAARHCAKGGWLYVWLYGTESQRGGIARRVAFHLERATRPIIARNLSSPFARAVLATLSCGYIVAKWIHRLRTGTMERYTYRRALHAARDRFTPLYAHRQDFPEVATWLREVGFEPVEQVDWREMPAANQANYRRNTGVRGRRARALSA